MTVNEAKKIIDMCSDIIHKISNEEPYVNKNYVLSILDMIDTVDQNEKAEEDSKNKEIDETSISETENNSSELIRLYESKSEKEEVKNKFEFEPVDYLELSRK